MERHYNENDPHLNKMIFTLRRTSLGKFHIENDLESIVRFYTQYIFISTCVHEMVGNILKYVYDPRLLSIKLHNGETIRDMYPDAQSYQQSVLFGIITTLTKLPKLTDDTSEMFPDKNDVVAMGKFIQKLNNLSKKINARNETRDYSFNGANPKYLQISMSAL